MKISDAARYLQQSEKTVRRWIQQKKLPARLVKGRYEIDNNALAALVGDTVAPLDTRGMLEALQRDLWEVGTRLGRLEASIDDLKTQLATVPTPHPRVLLPARPEYTIAPTEDIAPGSVLLHQFAKVHGVNRRTFLDQVNKNGLAHIAILKKNRPGETNRWFSPAQQGAVIAFWQANGTPYTACDACPHK